MIPSTTQIMVNSSTTLMAEIVPLLPEGYGQGTTAAVAMLALFTAQEVDRAADVRLNDITSMQAILSTLSKPIRDFDPALSNELDDAVAKTTDSLMVSWLDQRHAELSTLLISVHEMVEGNHEPWARAAERQILNHLVNAAERRILIIPQPASVETVAPPPSSSTDNAPTPPRTPASSFDFSIVKSVT